MNKTSRSFHDFNFTKFCCYFAILCHASMVGAEPIRDDFSDNNISDADPIQWITQGSSVSFEGPDLQLETSSIGPAAIVEVAERNSTGWSMRARALQQAGDTTGLGTLVGSDTSYLILTPEGTLRVGEEGGNILGSVETMIDARGQDFIIQLDTFDNELRAWAWPVSSPPATQEPMVTADSMTLANAGPAFWVNDFSGNGIRSRSLFRWFEFSDEHIAIPVPEPSSFVLLSVCVVILTLRRNRALGNIRHS